ncbi:uncharacterized protein N7482_008650 [Penicillium canariense]|uniref:Uncharacterized protein n=1 Tax=Penicillium canariense TaxID=189055 RepID=A0A9W9HWE4_9EURO|nr:uncharacterized protein N7482_008650 [Penicillium canariense]KAJ5157550.1 hypothetical protein N7482_008650 [Penicillium canariense]
MSPASARSDSIESAPPELDDASASRLFHIYKPAFRRHYEIKSADHQPLYYADISAFTHGKPDLTLHAGTNNQAPKVAASKFLKLSGDSKLALGDPDDMANTQWEDMTKESAIHSKYRLEMTIPSTQGAGYGERRAFLWKRTHSVKVDDTKSLSLSMRCFKMIDERTEQVVAVFTRERSFTKCGTLQIRVEFGEEFEKMALISGLSLYERSRRRNHAAAGGGGGGG